MKRLVIPILLAFIATSYSFAQFSASVWYDGYWSDWHTIYPSNYKLYGNYSSMIIYASQAHRSSYNFKFTIANYRTPSKDELKQYRKNNEWIQYNGTAEYYITDDYMTIKDIFKETNFPSICPWKHQVDKGQTPCLKRTVNAIIRIQAYKDHPKRYSIIFDDVALCIDLESLYFKE